MWQSARSSRSTRSPVCPNEHLRQLDRCTTIAVPQTWPDAPQRARRTGSVAPRNVVPGLRPRCAVNRCSGSGSVAPHWSRWSVWRPPFGQPLPGPVWPLGHGETGPIRCRIGRAVLASIAPLWSRWSVWRPPFGQPLPGPVWPLGHGEASSIHRRSSRSCLARFVPLWSRWSVWRPPFGQPLPGPVWPQGHDEPDPLHRNTMPRLRSVASAKTRRTGFRSTAVRCGRPGPLHHEARCVGPASLAPAKAFWEIGTVAACKRCAGPGPSVSCWSRGSGWRPPVREVASRTNVAAGTR
jgi:hypothetical protein